MTDAEKREASRQFFQKWHGKGKEDEDDRSYWLDILQRIMGAEDATDRVEFQKKVIVDGHTKKIDAYIPETKIIIEQKTLGIALDKKIHQSGGIDLTPYEQAKRYNDNLPSSEKARWIITSNFAEIWIYDMDTRVPEDNITKISIKELQSHYSMLDFLLEKKVKKISREVELSQEAGTLVGKIYDSFLKQYHHPDDKKTLESLNILCVRLVFCLYAEDAGLFDSKNSFSAYLQQYEPKDMRQALISLFKVLDTPLSERPDMYLSEELESFPYVNGGLFAKEDIIIPKITQEIKDTLVESSHFNWKEISPTIFGAVFESTLNPETRRSGGMHYTSIENIHKVIDPLFLDDLKAEFAEILKIGVQKTKERKLKDFQDKIAGLTFFDPACGSGNFLTETYVSLRRLENDILRELQGGQITFGDTSWNPIKVSIAQFYGIEINDFAADVAKTALWIAESQMMRETEDIVLMHLNFLPLKSNVNIRTDNALTIDWETVVPKDKLSYIMGNPPFVGKKEQTKEQKQEITSIFGKTVKGVGNLDYVSAWYQKAITLIQNTIIRCAFVSTNSITQGEQVAPLWKHLLNQGIHIDFAYKTFQWDSEAHLKAHVHCVIIGFSCIKENPSYIFHETGEKQKVKNISPYLVDAPSVIVDNRGKVLCNAPTMQYGSMPIDDGHLILDEADINELLAENPNNIQMVREYAGGAELLKNKKRWCLWLNGISPSVITKSRFVMDRVRKTEAFRRSSNRPQTLALAETPTLFGEIRQPSTKMLVVPKVSSETRRYIPICYVEPSTIINGSALIVPDANLYHLGILISNVHMSWMRTVCGRMKSDYQYSANVVYNNFPWPEITEAQKAKIEKTAQGILDARNKYPDTSLADLYNPLTMPKELLTAHRKNDAAVMEAYGLSVKDTSEADCVAFLMQKYQELTSK